MMRTDDAVDCYNTIGAMIAAWIVMALILVATLFIRSYAADSGVPNTEIGIRTYNTEYEERVSDLEKKYHIHPTKDMTIYDRVAALEEVTGLE